MIPQRRVGLWLIGANGGVGSTTALGLAALAAKLTPSTGLVTLLPEFASVDFDAPAAFVVGGHDIRWSSLSKSLQELHERSNIFSVPLLNACRETLDEWSQNVKVGVAYHPSDAVTASAGGPSARIRLAKSPRNAIDLIREDLRSFKEHHHLDDVVVVNVASTEPPFPTGPEHASLATLTPLLERADVATLPTSSLYAWAAVESGLPYVNLTPSLGGTFPAFDELCQKYKVPHLGQDAKTGETLMKSVLAPLFKMRHLKVLSWVGHNILGNRDGQVLSDPANKASKVKSKHALVGEMLGYEPQSHVSIEYIESLDDWKTAWDHIHFEGFLSTKMTLQFTWQGCDSVLAAPLVIDLARIALLAHRRGDVGPLLAVASFFKSPLGVSEHDMGKQFGMLVRYLLDSQESR